MWSYSIFDWRKRVKRRGFLWRSWQIWRKRYPGITHQPVYVLQSLSLSHHIWQGSCGHSVWQCHLQSPSPGKGDYIPWECYCYTWPLIHSTSVYLSGNMEHLIHHRSAITVNSVCLSILQLCLGQLLFFPSLLITRAVGEFCRNSGLVFMRKWLFSNNQLSLNLLIIEQIVTVYLLSKNNVQNQLTLLGKRKEFKIHQSAN